MTRGSIGALAEPENYNHAQAPSQSNTAEFTCGPDTIPRKPHTCIASVLGEQQVWSRGRTTTKQSTPAGAQRLRGLVTQDEVRKAAESHIGQYLPQKPCERVSRKRTPWVIGVIVAQDLKECDRILGGSPWGKGQRRSVEHV